MPLEVRKKNKESSIALIRRFSRAIQESGILQRARTVRYHQREKSHQMKKRCALRREEKKREYEKLKKIGKI